jgi:hypothetical protein
LTNANDAPFTALRQGNKFIQRYGFRVNVQLFRNLQDGLMQRFWVNIVADKVNVNGGARAAKQR